MKEYFYQIRYKNFKPITVELWESLLLDGWPEELEDSIPENYKYIQVELSSEDKDGLKNSNESVIEKFNDFDIKLKKIYSDEYLDLIDYDEGEVYIIKYIPGLDKEAELRERLAVYNLMYGYPGDFLYYTFREHFTDLTEGDDEVISPEDMSDSFDIQSIDDYIDRMTLLKQALQDKMLQEDTGSNF